MDLEILNAQVICILHFIARPGTSVEHRNKQEVTEDKWMLTNSMTDDNHPSNSDFMVWGFPISATEQ